MRVSRSSFAMMTVCHLALIHQREQPLHAGPVQVLRRLAAVHDQLDDLGSLHDSHGADLRLLGFERNAVVGLLVC